MSNSPAISQFPASRGLPLPVRRKSWLASLWTGAVLLFPFMDIFLSRYTFQLFPGPLGYGPFLCFYALLPVFLFRYPFPSRVMLTLLAVGAVGASGWLTGMISGGDFLKVFGSLLLPYLYYGYLWQYLDLDVRRAFGIYLKGATFIAGFGLFNFVDYVLGAGMGDLFKSLLSIQYSPAAWGIRIASTLGEPTYFANTIAPAGLFVIYRLFFADAKMIVHLEEAGLLLSRRSAWIILIALVFTYSTMAYLGILLAATFILLFQGQTRIALLLPLVFYGFFFFAQQIPEVNERLEGILNADQVSEENIHGSSAILYNHAIITWENFQRNPLYGSGLGTHAEATVRFNILGDTMNAAYGEFNATDASSMFLRIASELGLFGVVLTLYFLFTHYFRVAPETVTHDQLIFKLVSAACLVTIILQLLRQGNFILNGFPFFVYGYYYARRQYDLSLHKNITVG
jgi:hypothetical protein